MSIRIEVTKRACLDEDDLHRMLKAYLGVPDSSGVAVRPELNHDDSILVGLSVQWIEPPVSEDPQP